jgi:hypothetical protein
MPAEIDTKPKPSSYYLFAACCTIEAAHEPDDLDEARAMLERWGMTYEDGIRELMARGVIPSD